jgi:hypothetical protein
LGQSYGSAGSIGSYQSKGNFASFPINKAAFNATNDFLAQDQFNLCFTDQTELTKVTTDQSALSTEYLTVITDCFVSWGHIRLNERKMNRKFLDTLPPSFMAHVNTKFRDGVALEQ